MFIHRFSSTIVLLTVLSGIIFAPKTIRCLLFYGICILLTSLLTREITDALKNVRITTYEKYLPYITGGCTALLGLIIFDRFFALVLWNMVLIICIGTAVVILLILLAVNDMEKIRVVLNSLLVHICVIVPVMIIIMIYFAGERFNERFTIQCNLWFLFFILMTKIGDIGAYVVGTLSNKLLPGGNHKMIPVISPGKSWEGMAGGLIITILFGLLFVRLACWRYPMWAVIVISVFFYFAGMAGDLAESSFKRAAGIKDSGHLIPGIGGVFDLVDSPFLTGAFFLPVSVIVYYFFR